MKYTIRKQDTITPNYGLYWGHALVEGRWWRAGSLIVPTRRTRRSGSRCTTRTAPIPIGKLRGGA